ncbi:hydantoinase B/oxoprolinase family protein [Rhizomonospora bruguierae]|uniref:hydantoinase B/oxoprolinase family protein n=1 Tax=Rhizomonospora bruguierae TaxID=1581705 RepID=UPI001BCE391C|nr:hydantoinase B/oxoprolinase family protein [Micromonospora sp. NBRC 107566]
MSENLDPVTFEVIWHRLLDTTEEMGIKYMRTSGSPILVGAYDASTGICLPDGQLVAMGPYITTQAHVLRLIIDSVIKKRQAAPGLGPGDMYICNDPYLGATHQPDVATVAPFFVGDQLSAWVGSSGHWLDIGGSEPGGFNMNATSVFDEGLRLPPTRIVENGSVREDLVELIMSQVREPLVELDLRGQIVSNEAGIQRLTEIFDDYGSDAVTAVMKEGISHVERRLRARLRSLPDGVWREVQFLDHDGHKPNLRRIVCTITKRGDRLSIDFTGTDPQVEGFANAAYGGLRASTLSAVCILLGYDLTWNDGIARCVDIVAPPGTAMTAEYPTPVSMATISAIIVNLNLVFAALSKMLLSSPKHHDEAMANWCGTSLGVSMLGYNDRGLMTVAPESSHFAAGGGARTYADGVDTGGIIINTTANIPSIEQTEAEYPLLYLFRRQLRDSGGPGKYRGGMSAGVAIAPYGAMGDMHTTFAGVGADTPNAFGLGGGLPGAAVRFVRYVDSGLPDLLAAGAELPGSEETLPGDARVTGINRALALFETDTIEYHNWQGGGGYGDPIERSADRVAADVLAQAVSVRVALDVYGVVVTDGGEVDVEATAAARDAIVSGRLATAKPARDVLGRPDPILDAATGEPRVAGATGRSSYGDLVDFDFAANEARCARCSWNLGSADADFKYGCLVEVSPVAVAGPARGQDYGRDAVMLRRFYCPGCARQIEAEVAAPEGPHALFHLRSPAGQD